MEDKIIHLIFILLVAWDVFLATDYFHRGKHSQCVVMGCCAVGITVVYLSFYPL